MPCEDEGRFWGDALYTHLGILKIATEPPDIGRVTNVLLWPSKETHHLYD